MMDDTTWIMRIELKVPVGKSFEFITIFTIYAPYMHKKNSAEQGVEEFWMELENEITRTPKVVGGDLSMPV